MRYKNSSVVKAHVIKQDICEFHIQEVIYWFKYQLNFNWNGFTQYAMRYTLTLSYHIQCLQVSLFYTPNLRLEHKNVVKLILLNLFSMQKKQQVII